MEYGVQVQKQIKKMIQIKFISTKYEYIQKIYIIFTLRKKVI